MLHSEAGEETQLYEYTRAYRLHHRTFDLPGSADRPESKSTSSNRSQAVERWILGVRDRAGGISVVCRVSSAQPLIVI